MRFRDERGSAMVEMTFVFPIIIVVIVVMLFFGMFMYEKVAAQAVLDDVASRAAANWATADRGVYKEGSANEGFSLFDVYSRILDFKDRARREKIESEALRRLRIICLFKDTFKDGDVAVDSVNVVVYKTLTVTVTRTFRLPFGTFLKNWLGVSNELRYRLRAEAVVQDPPELIRTVDFAADLMEKNQALRGFFDKMQSAMGKVSEFFKNVSLNG